MPETYFYKFIEPFNEKLAFVARDLEKSIYVSPRTMLTHARTFVETLLATVMQKEKISADSWITLKERLDILDEKGYLTPEVRNALHYVRKVGNQAAHDTRSFRYSEALLSWESIYIIVKWYVEVYGPVEFEVPSYQDPEPESEKKYDLTELEVRLKGLEELFKASVDQGREEKKEKTVSVSPVPVIQEQPGYTAVRTITYKDKQLAIPHFLRDAFLLPQRFDKSETFLIRLGAEQQARIMSELPSNFEGLHKQVKRFNESSDAIFFDELAEYIEEEKARRKIMIERPGEVFLFYKTDYIIVTEKLAKIKLTKEEFTGIPSLTRQLQEDTIETIGHLPKELVILAKYNNVGVGTIRKLFEQMKQKQQFLQTVLT